MNTYDAERTAEALERGRIKEWPWRYYRVTNEKNQFGGTIQVDCDSALAEEVSMYAEDVKIIKIDKAEFESLKGKKVEFSPYEF